MDLALRASMLRLLPMPSLTFLPSLSLASGCSSPTTTCRGKLAIYVNQESHAESTYSSVSIDGFWANGLGKEGTLTVGEDEDGA